MKGFPHTGLWVTIMSLIGFFALSVHAAAKGESITIQHIANGIRAHVADNAAKHDGYYQIRHEGNILNLELIRIHMEYLSNLGDGVQFACVDLVDKDGTVYDVDFFLAGTEPGNLRVTEETVHKLDGKPFYTWEQADNGIWRRVELEHAGDELFGVRHGVDAFRFSYRFKIPSLSEPGRLWVPFAQSDSFQEVRVERIETPTAWKLVKENRYANTALYLEPKPEHSGQTVEIIYMVERSETGPYETHPSEEPKHFLQPESMVPLNETFRQIASRVLAQSGATNNLMRARELYNHTIDELRYARHGEGWGVGDAVYACNVKSGNCSDFHSYFIALARAADIPARFIIGAAIPSARDEGGIMGYHCWAEFYADGRWWPVDISEGNKYRQLADYYFGKNPANRLEISRGRDLEFQPNPSDGPMNFLVYPILESGGTVTTHPPVFEFERLEALPTTKTTWNTDHRQP